MSDRILIIIGFAALLAVICAAAVTARLRRDRIATLGEVVDYLMRKRVARILAVLVWAWSGWHFLAR